MLIYNQMNPEETILMKFQSHFKHVYSRNIYESALYKKGKYFVQTSMC